MKSFSWRSVGETFLRGYEEAATMRGDQEIVVVVRREGELLVDAARA